ncbi:hypothetical protein NNJEOMEG_03004 [Fundidesulfovibrio magnetotacticus]|uniref:Restriction endonuclease domain-containing protein n=1 Tax=Fundidesulfovibrio magnetotacticus TaxID=2730080 RepID=A0A6V8LZD5_9BACT|nr:Uma2 family endonuclease [Fundidesulfovibrio magnetotacticus]GFK95146.1 hypothetical protein NNJEOMEG_03004 [Fundidesulfovibrio magnetotacticus]
MAQRADARHTYGDYLAWKDDERWDFLPGEAHAWTPARSRSHQQVVVRLASILAYPLEGRPCEVFVAPFDVRLPEPGESDEATSSVVRVTALPGVSIDLPRVFRESAWSRTQKSPERFPAPGLINP